MARGRVAVVVLAAACSGGGDVADTLGPTASSIDSHFADLALDLELDWSGLTTGAFDYDADDDPTGVDLARIAARGLADTNGWPADGHAADLLDDCWAGTWLGDQPAEARDDAVLAVALAGARPTLAAAEHPNAFDRVRAVMVGAQGGPRACHRMVENPLARTGTDVVSGFESDAQQMALAALVSQFGDVDDDVEACRVGTRIHDAFDDPVRSPSVDVDAFMRGAMIASSGRQPGPFLVAAGLLDGVIDGPAAC